MLDQSGHRDHENPPISQTVEFPRQEREGGWNYIRVKKADSLEQCEDRERETTEQQCRFSNGERDKDIEIPTKSTCGDRGEVFRRGRTDIELVVIFIAVGRHRCECWRTFQEGSAFVRTAGTHDLPVHHLSNVRPHQEAGTWTLHRNLWLTRETSPWHNYVPGNIAQ